MLIYRRSTDVKAVLLTIVVVMFVSACGGGGGGDAPASGTPDTVPTPGRDVDLNTGLILRAGDAGMIQYNSMTPRNIEELVRGNYSTASTMVSGYLTLPQNRNGKVPLVIIAHSSGGVSNRLYDYWTPVLTSNGIAAFVIDSYTTRNPAQAPSGQAQISHSVQMVDAMIAMRLLSRHPDIDAGRIAYMGFSAGAQAVQATAFEETRRQFLAPGVDFAAYISYYPVCERRQWSPNITRSPMLTLAGELDQLGTAAACVEHNDNLRRFGADVTTIVYPGVYHSFDSAGFTTLDNILSLTQCSGEFRFDTLVKRNYMTGQTYDRFRDYFAYLNQCIVARTMTLGGSVASRDNSTAAVVNLLKQVFALP